MLPFQPPTRLMLHAVESPRPGWIWCVNVHFRSVLDLQSTRLNALQLCEILMHSFGALGSLIAFHQWWAIATKVKHFRDHKQAICKKNELKRIAFELFEAARLAAEQAERVAELVERAAERAAERLQAVCNLISAAPAHARSTSSSRSSAPDTFATVQAPPLPATQQTDDDDDGVVPTADQREAADAAATAAASRTGGTEFGDFVNKWSMPGSDDGAEWRTVAEEISGKFQAMLNKPIGGWKRHASDTVQTRLDELSEFRAHGAQARKAAAFPREFETKVTHPFVFAVLNETVQPLQSLQPPATTLHLYTENVGKIANKLMYRNADAMLFGDAEKIVSKLDACALRDSLVAVEAKRWLNAQGQADALVGGERDFVIVSGDAPSEEMRVGTSVFTDGVEWYFARMAWRFSDRGKWTRVIKISSAVDVTASDGWLQLARWFAFAFDQAVTMPREPTGLSQIEWTVGSADSWQLADVLSSGTRSIVSRWRKGTESTIVKFTAESHFAERTRLVQFYFTHELEMLRKFAEKPSFVHVNALFPVCGGDIYVALEDGGAALASFNIRGAAGRVLAKVVHLYIWVGALAALKEHSLCHFDITENNVVVAADRASAKLIDLESVTGVGQSAAASPTAAIKEVRPAVASVEFDEQCVCAILHCLLSAEIATFEERSSFLAQFGADDERQRIVDEIASDDAAQLLATIVATANDPQHAIPEHLQRLPWFPIVVQFVATRLDGDVRGVRCTEALLTAMPASVRARTFGQLVHNLALRVRLPADDVLQALAPSACSTDTRSGVQ
jgi:hypothetical protein